MVADAALCRCIGEHRLTDVIILAQQRNQFVV